MEITKKIIEEDEVASDQEAASDQEVVLEEKSEREGL